MATELSTPAEVHPFGGDPGPLESGRFAHVPQHSKRRAFILAATGIAAALALTVSGLAPASAASRTLRNDPPNQTTATCSGNLVMTYYITQRTDVSSATYLDEYLTSSGWREASARHLLSDSNTADKTMITNLSATSVRVRANAFVTTTQGPNC